MKLMNPVCVLGARDYRFAGGVYSLAGLLRDKLRFSLSNWIAGETSMAQEWDLASGRVLPCAQHKVAVQNCGPNPDGMVRSDMIDGALPIVSRSVRREWLPDERLKLSVRHCCSR